MNHLTKDELLAMLERIETDRCVNANQLQVDYENAEADVCEEIEKEIDRQYEASKVNAAEIEAQLHSG